MVGLLRRAKVPFSVRYRTSREIFSQSMRMLRRERDLWVFPLLSAGAMLLVLVPIVLVSIVWGDRLFLGASPLRPVLVALAALPLAFPFAVLATLFNAALCFAARERMLGRKGRKMDAWRRAVAQLGPVVRFNLFGMLVAGVLSIVGQLLAKLRLVPYLGQVVEALGLFAWGVAAYFVIPILVVEREPSAISAIRSSAQMARSQWGKTTAGLVTITLALMVPSMALLFLLMLPVMVLPILGSELGWAWALDAFLRLMWVSLGLGFAIMVVGWVFSSAMHTLYQTALYEYARTGKVRKPYSKETLVDAWTPYREA